MSKIVTLHPQDDKRQEHVHLDKHGDSQMIDINCSTGTLVELIEVSIKSIQETPLCPQELQILNICLQRAQTQLSHLILATSAWGGIS